MTLPSKSCTLDKIHPVAPPLRQSNATLHLDRLGIPYRIFQHDHKPGSLEEAARERGQDPSQVIRSILFRKTRDDFFMVLIAGPGQISWRSLRAHLGTARISLARTDEVRMVTGYEIGTVNPFGLPDSLRVLADASVFEPEELSIGSGIPGMAIIMRSADLRQAIGKLETGSFAL